MFKREHFLSHTTKARKISSSLDFVEKNSSSNLWLVKSILESNSESCSPFLFPLFTGLEQTLVYFAVIFIVSKKACMPQKWLCMIKSQLMKAKGAWGCYVGENVAHIVNN
jgi:hypothetical protein